MNAKKLAKIGALLLALFAAAGLRAQSALDGFDPNASGSIWVAVVQPDGKILIGGDFTTLSPNGGPAVARNRMARLNVDGTLDTGFNPNADGGITSIAVQADGKILAGGFFTSIGGQPRNHFARLDATSGLADSFNPDSNDTVFSIAVQPDGKILVGGVFGFIGGQTRHSLARLDPNTGLADSLNPSPEGLSVDSIALQANGKILVGGSFVRIGGQPRNNIARLDGATGLADSFDPNGTGVVRAIAVQADGKILAGGDFNHLGGQNRNRIARLDPMTGLADSFDPNAEFNSVNTIALQADGKILVGGYFTRIGGQERNGIARLDPTTGLPDSFDPNAKLPSTAASVLSIAVQADGKILAGGSFDTLEPNGGPPVTRHNIARLEKDGRLDQTVNLSPTGFGEVSATVVQPDGKILIGGSFTNVAGVPRNGIARLNTDRTLDMAFDPNVSGPIKAIALQADGKILIGGLFPSVGGQPRTRLARLDPVTGQPDSFDPNADNRVLSILVQNDGKILVSGNFTHIGGQLRNRIARLDPTTGLPDSFDPNANNEVGSMAVQADGKIVVSGAFTTIGGQSRKYLARLDPVTGLPDSFSVDPGGNVYAVLLQPDGKILVGGSIMKRYRPDGTRDTVFNTGFGGGANPIFSLALQADGKVFVGGIFSGQIGGQQRSGIARLDGVTGMADSFVANAPGFNASGHSIPLQPDGKLLTGFARLTNDTAAGQNLAVTKSTVTWTFTGASPQVSRVVFEYSTDNVNYTVLGNGTFNGSSWTLTGLTFPIEQNFYVRARGHYRTGIQNGSGSIMESVRNAFILRPSNLRNISTRLQVQTGDNAMIGGFIITGTQTKTVIVRGIGPSLPIPGALADPVIEVHGSSGQLLAVNDNWNDSLTREQIIESGLAPTNDLEPALWGVIDPGAYTVVVRGTNNGTGIGLFEVYDLDPMADSKLANVSTRGFVGTGDNVLIGGTIVAGENPTRVLFRALGPSLTNFGIPNALSDPILELHDGNGQLIAIDDNWRDAQEAQIIATGLAPSNNLESAILRDLLPGNYTSIVRGLGNTTGVALIEAYEVDF